MPRTLRRRRATSVIRAGVALGSTLALVTVMAACSDDGGGSSASTPGVTDSKIVVGTHQPLTGPAAAGYSKISAATKAYFAYVNSKGGVNGRKIEYKVEDDGYNPANTQTVVRKLVLQDKVFAILNGLGTPTHTGVLDFLKSNRVPDLFVASGSRTWDQPDKYPGTFGYNLDYTSEGKILATYVKKTFTGKKVCFFGQNDDFGKDALAGLEQILGKDGIAAKQNYVTSNTKVAPQVGALKAAGCQVNILATVPGFTALTIGTAAKLGYKAQWVVSNVGGDYNTLKGLLGPVAGPLLNGLVTDGYLPPSSDAANPWNVLFQQLNDKYNNKAPWDGNVEYGFSVGYLFVQALQKAGKDLTRDGIQKAIEKGGFTGGPGIVPLRFSADDHSGYSGGQIAVVSGGKQSGVGTPYVTDTGSGPVTEYTEAAAAPPASGVPSA
jgi:branched-chain amino acid transport system substrate-binding protein